VHFQKEEDLQLPALDAAPAERTEAILKRMHTEIGNGPEHAHQ